MTSRTSADARRMRVSLLVGTVVHALALGGLVQASEAAHQRQAAEPLLWIDAIGAEGEGEGANDSMAAKGEGDAASIAKPAPTEAEQSPAPAVEPLVQAAGATRVAAPSVESDAKAASKRIEPLLGTPDHADSMAAVAGDSAGAGTGFDSGGRAGIAANDGRGSGSAGLARSSAGGGNSARSSRPVLLAGSQVCRDLFPYAATDDRGVVKVALAVRENGAPDLRRVLIETPSGQGFANAARACAARLRFRPARDAAGAPVMAKSVVKLVFERT